MMFNYMKQFWKENFVVGLLLLGSAVSQTIATMLMTSLFNSLIALDFEQFAQAVLQMFLVYLIFLAITYFEVVKKYQTIQTMLTAIREDITLRMERTSYSGFHEKEVGTYTSWLSNDMNTIAAKYDQTYTVISGIIATLTSVVALLFFHWSIVVWSFIAAGITLLLPKIYEKQLGEVTLEMSQENEHFVSKSNNILGGFDTLFSYSLLKKITKEIKKGSKALEKANDKQARTTGKVAILGAFGNVFGQLSVMLLTGWLVFQNILTVGAVTSAINLVSTIFNTVGNVSQQLASIRSAAPIFEKFETISFDDNKNKEALTELNSGFQLNNLSYAYGEKEILKDIDYHFSLKNKYAIVGASGSGKSTLLNVLNGKLTDYKGSAQFSKQEVKNIDGKDLRDFVLYIDQSPYLFDGTIGYNITLGEEFTEEEMLQAIKDSDLEELIEKLPAGLDTPVGEGGRSLSGGQRQRISLARGLIRGKTFILLDEGTSSLDEESAIRIEESLVTNPDLTVIMITHHLRENTKSKLDGILALT